jgi:hypothetical protein
MSNNLGDLDLNILDDEYFIVDQDVDDIEPRDDDGPSGSKPKEDSASEGEGSESVAGEGEVDGKGSSKDGSQSLPNLYSSLAKALGEEGFLSDLKYDEIDSFDKLGEEIRKANSKNIESALGFSLDGVNELNDLQKEYLQALSQGIPAETFVQAKRGEVNLDGITDELLASDENLRKQIIIDSYLAKGIAPEKAEKMAQMHFDLAEDLVEAKTARDEIKAMIEAENQREFEYQKSLREQQINEQRQYEEDLKNAFYNTDKLGETFEIPRQLKDQMFKLMTKPVARTEDGTLVNELTKYQIENPIDYQHKVAWLYSITDGFKKFDDFVTKKARTKATMELESVLNSTNFDKMGNVSSPEHDDAAVYGLRDYKFDDEEAI